MSDAPFPATPLAEQIDTQFRAALARRFASLSPSALLQAASDWTLHLAASPGKRMDLAHLAMRQAQELASYTLERMNAGRDRPTRHGVQPPAQDRRFAAPEWQQWPFNYMHQSYLLTEQWWEAATHGVTGVEKHHENVVAFAARQLLDMFSPGNQLATNPVVLQRTLQQRQELRNLVLDAVFLFLACFEACGVVAKNVHTSLPSEKHSEAKAVLLPPKDFAAILPSTTPAWRSCHVAKSLLHHSQITADVRLALTAVTSARAMRLHSLAPSTRRTSAASRS